ncbi:MAG: STAS domain-containing protein, partial [Anaerolineae bacterium]|nr:STAS domain-containing protein [Anaerolineae bacterium]
ARMNINILEHNLDIHVIELGGRLDAFTVGTLRDLQTRYAAEDSPQIILDLTETTFMDSAWISALVSLLKAAKKVGGNVILVPPRDGAALNILKITRFDQVFTMEKSVKEALDRFYFDD